MADDTCKTCPMFEPDERVMPHYCDDGKEADACGRKFTRLQEER